MVSEASDETLSHPAGVWRSGVGCLAAAMALAAAWWAGPCLVWLLYPMQVKHSMGPLGWCMAVVEVRPYRLARCTPLSFATLIAGQNYEVLVSMRSPQFSREPVILDSCVDLVVDAQETSIEWEGNTVTFRSSSGSVVTISSPSEVPEPGRDE